MGTWSHKILGNDTSCEVRERFIELYNSNLDNEEIKSNVLEEQKGNIECDPYNVWFGYALICWECKCLDDQVLRKVAEIVNSGADIKFNLELDADEEFISKRKLELRSFIDKISKPKDKARRRIKPPKEFDFPIKQGSFYKLTVNANYDIKILITYSKHYKNKGEIRYINLLDDSEGEHGIGALFIPSKYYWPQGRVWNEFYNGGSSYSLDYNKENKNDFENILNYFEKIDAEIKIDFDRLNFNIRWDNVDYSNVAQFEELIFKRWREDTEINFRATTINELIELINLERPKEM